MRARIESAACLAWLMLLSALAPGSLAYAQAGIRAGTPIVQILTQLRDEGTTVIYSSDLVPESLAVISPPGSGTTLEILAAALDEHGLVLAQGPRGSLLVARAADARADTVRPSTDQAVGVVAPRVPPPLENVIVTASRYTFARSTGASTSHVDRLQLENAPTLGDDALRTLQGLPGVTSSGLSARSNVRGGVSDESLLLLDGVRLYDPFHLKDFESIFGSISPRIVERVDVHAGGYPANFGDRMSAVIEMHSVVPNERRHHEVGVSTLTSSALSSGTFSDGRGDWLASIRRGNLDLLIDAANSDIGSPQYGDFFGRTSYMLDGGGAFGFGLMLLNDKIVLNDGDQRSAGADYDDSYLWLRFEHELGSAITAEYLLSRTRLDARRDGRIDDPEVVLGSLADRRTYDVDTVKSDWTLTASDRQTLAWGLELSRATASYDYALARMLPAPIRSPLAMPPTAVQTSLNLDDDRSAVYVNYRGQIGDAFTLEAGGRWDAQSYLDDDQFSPRVSALWDVSDRASLRVSWGRYHQAQGINEMQVGDGLSSLFPAQRSEHSIASFEFNLSDATSIRLEAYHNRFTNVRPRFENLFTRVSLLPELLPDRVMLSPERARARGFELFVESDLARWRWWAGFARSTVEDRLDGVWVRRSWQEPWSSKGGMMWFGSSWTVSASLTVRSGWPISSIVLDNGELAADVYNDASFENFRSLDLRANREISLKRGTVDVFFELNNALNADNPCCFEYELQRDPGGVVTDLAVQTNRWLSAVPTIGFLWQF